MLSHYCDIAYSKLSLKLLYFYSFKKYLFMALIKTKGHYFLFLKAVVILFLLQCCSVSAAPIKIKCGFQIICAVGTHINRIGISGFAFTNTKVQTGILCSYYFNLKALGPNNRYAECNINTLINYGFIKNKNTPSTLDAVAVKYQLNTNYKYNIGYCYQWFINRNGTSQVIGTINAKYKNVAVLVSNDLLAKAY
jgi:hypothetical protein